MSMGNLFQKPRKATSPTVESRQLHEEKAPSVPVASRKEQKV